jgi:hypothetical protein
MAKPAGLTYSAPQLNGGEVSLLIELLPAEVHRVWCGVPLSSRRRILQHADT